MADGSEASSADTSAARGAAVQPDSEGGRVAVLNNTLVNLNLCLRRGFTTVACRNDLAPGEWFLYDIPQKQLNSNFKLEGRLSFEHKEYKEDDLLMSGGAVVAGVTFLVTAVLTGSVSLWASTLCTVPVWAPALVSAGAACNYLSQAALAGIAVGSVIKSSVMSPSEFMKKGVPVNGSRWLRVIGGPGSNGGPSDLAGYLDASRAGDFVVEEGEWQVFDKFLESLRESNQSVGGLPISYAPVLRENESQTDPH